MNVQVLDAKVDFRAQPFRRPLVLSSGAIRDLAEAVAEVTVEVAGRRATGRGSIYLSDLWAWPDPAVPHEQRVAEMVRLCEQIARDLPTLCGPGAGHPLELGLRLHEHVCAGDRPPALARAVCASPFDAAIHDAAGAALGVSAFALYDGPAEMPSAGPLLGPEPWRAVAEALRPPRRRLRAWYVVGKDDADEDLAPWVRDRGYRCFKIKLLARGADEDAARTAEVYRMVRRLGARDVELSADTNEANRDAEEVLDYLRHLRRIDGEAFAALRYVEQPTPRDILRCPFDWRAVGRLKPVLLDEGLTGPELLPEALRQGYAGLALKTCKGHSFCLLAAAWARRHGMKLALQDLTNPGLSMIHAALLAAHLETINDVELNSPQFTPAANADWLPRLAGLFDPRGGVHQLPEGVPTGVGSRW